MKLKIHIPEAAGGILATVAIFTTGMTIALSGALQSNAQASNYSNKVQAAHSPQPFSWDWFTNDGTVFFTTVLSLIAALQAGLFVWQLLYMRKSMKHATIAATAAQQSAATARDAFVKLERPYIYIFGAKGLKSDFNQEDNFYSVEYSIANYGKTPASIESAQIRISVDTEPEAPRPVGVWHDFMVSPILIPGERRNDVEETIPNDVEIGEAAGEHSPPHPVPELIGDKAFFLWVKIRYSGPFSDSHETSACWRWDEKSERLILYNDEEYNYRR